MADRKAPDERSQQRVAHACFDCRVSFRVKPRQGRASCPNCSGTLYEMGRAFKAPKKRQKDQWKKFQALYAYGFRFFSYDDLEDSVPLPERYKDIAAFMKDNPDHPLRVAEPQEALLKDAGVGGRR